MSISARVYGNGKNQQEIVRVGDRIIVTEGFLFDDVYFDTDSTGTVLVVDNHKIGVRWDKFNPRLHTLGGRCKNGYGWYFTNADYLAIIDESKDWDTSDMDEYFLSLKCE